MPKRPNEGLFRKFLRPRRITDHQSHTSHDLAVAFDEELLERHPCLSIT
jgi:hypothetical protein